VLRNLLLVGAAVIVSFALTAVGGYVLYHSSGSVNDYQLSWFANHLLNPLIATATGLLVGSLSRRQAVPTAMVGVAPWALYLSVYGSRPWAAVARTFLELEFLGVVAAVLSRRFFRRRTNDHV